MNTSVFEQYQYKNWTITIENWRNTDKLVGFACLSLYVDIMSYNTVPFLDDIIDEYGLQFAEDDPVVLYAEPDDVVATVVNGVDVTNSTKVLEYMVWLIQQCTGASDEEITLVKVLYKKSPKFTTSKKTRGFLDLAWSAVVKERDKNCVRCGSTYKLHAHHIKSFKDHPDLRYEVSNGETLCQKCHIRHHKEFGR